MGPRAAVAAATRGVYPLLRGSLRSELRRVAPADQHQRDQEQRTEHHQAATGPPDGGAAAGQGELAATGAAAAGARGRSLRALARRRDRRRGGRCGVVRRGRRRRSGRGGPGRRRRDLVALDLHDLVGEDAVQQVRDDAVLAVRHLLEDHLALARLDPEVDRVRLAVELDRDLARHRDLVVVVVPDVHGPARRVLAALVRVDPDVGLVVALGLVVPLGALALTAALGLLADDGLGAVERRRYRNGDLGLGARLAAVGTVVAVVLAPRDRPALVALADVAVVATAATEAGGRRLGGLREIEVLVGDHGGRVVRALGGVRRAGERDTTERDDGSDCRCEESAPEAPGDKRHMTQFTPFPVLFL